MKKLASVFLFFTMFALLITSCKKDEDDREKFVGTYAISETWTLDGGGTGTDNYTVSISLSSVDENQVIIENLGNTITAFGAQMNVTATVTGNTLNIPTQSISVGDYSITVSGTGSLNDKLLTINYLIVGQWQGQCSGFKQ
jgi:hypothetical protein